jgi:hypothetical protein
MILLSEKEKKQKEIDEAVKKAKEKGKKKLVELKIPHEETGETYYGVFTLPTSHQIKILKKDPDTGSVVMAKGCLIYPDKELFGELIEEYPGFATSITNKLAELRGYGVEVEAKNL